MPSQEFLTASSVTTAAALFNTLVQQAGQMATNAAAIQTTLTEQQASAARVLLDLAQSINRKTAVDVDSIGTDEGLYSITGGPAAGQVWERLADGTTKRRQDLEAASQEMVQAQLMHIANPGTAQRVTGRTYGVMSEAVLHAVMANEPHTDPYVPVAGFETTEQASGYANRDSVAAYHSNIAPPALVLSKGDTAFTSTTCTAAEGWTGNTLDIVPGMWVETVHFDNAGVSSKWSGRVVSLIDNVLTVDVWVLTPSDKQTGVPANGLSVAVQVVNKVWARNSNVFMYANSYGSEMVVDEGGVFNYKGDYDPTNPNSPTGWGFDAVNLGTYRSHAGHLSRGDFYYGFFSRGQSGAGFVVEHDAEHNPQYAFLDTSGAYMTLYSRAPGAYFARLEDATGKVRFSVNNQGLIEFGPHVHLLDESGTGVLALRWSDGDRVLILDGQVRITQLAVAGLQSARANSTNAGYMPVLNEQGVPIGVAPLFGTADQAAAATNLRPTAAPTALTAAPTAADFNDLVQRLKSAGVLV